MNLPEILLKVWPLLVLQLAVQVAALLDLRKHDVTKIMPKKAWVFAILLTQMIGPILYFTMGRGEE